MCYYSEMCGRDYSTYTDEELFFRYLNKKGWSWPTAENAPSVKPNYNMCPTQSTFVLNVDDGKLDFREMRWGLVPAWAKTVKDADKYSMINAKSEEVAEKKSYKNAFKKRRCIVPVSGFYEWKRNGRTKVPFAIHLIEEKIMSLAGIWERWESKETKEIVNSYSLLTTSANSFMSEVHDRMPVILPPELEERWLDPAENDEGRIMNIINNCNSAKLSRFQISPLVNSPKNNSKEVLVPV